MQISYAMIHKQVPATTRIKLALLKKKGVQIKEEDVLVFPEIYGQEIVGIEPKCQKVIFNQNCYYTYQTYQFYNNPTTINYHDASIKGVIVVSEDSKRYINFAFPKAEVYRMFIGIKDTIFQYAPDKKKQICYMPRKLNEDIIQIIAILKQRGHLNDWNFVPIDNKTEEEVAQIMQESVFFLCLNHREGFGLPPVEAMACGCYVVGYHGEAGREYLKPEFSTVIEKGNIMMFVECVEQLVDQFEQNPQTILEKEKLASNFVSEQYSMKKQEKDILRIWNDILSEK